jgi:hypothetical protein|tara:strand:- start:15728 stop:16060 length:333 start_codon:yes stop_codon:yes gene_type:complete
MVRTQLYTSGGEFKRPNGSDYVGAYHVHVSQGAMVGGFHKTESHDKLTPSTNAARSLVQRIMSELSASQATPSRARRATTPPPRRTPRRTPRMTPTRSSGGSSGGSGGGY